MKINNEHMYINVPIMATPFLAIKSNATLAF